MAGELDLNPHLLSRPQSAFLAIAWLAVAAVTISTWGITYWDFGDGNYLYVSHRILEGVLPYRDILAPQPPLHLLAGALSQWLGSLIGNPLLGARLYCLLARLAAAWMIVLLARRAGLGGRTAVLASVIYLLLPIGFWWSLCLMSENLEIVFLLYAVWCILRADRGSLVRAGIASALATHCNMTGLPYFLTNALFLLCRRTRLAPWYIGSTVVAYLLGAFLAAWWTEGYFWSNVLFNQVGTFPRTDILSTGRPGYTFAHYAWEKITGQGANVLRLEGGLIAFAIAALVLRLRRVPRDAELTWEYLGWTSVGMALSICFTAKGGTEDYIFVLGEPAVALFAADGIVRLARVTWGNRRAMAGLRPGRTHPFLAALFPAVLVAWAAWTPMVHNILTLSEQQAEYPAAGVSRIIKIIGDHSGPGEPILAPPFYAYITGRTVAAELAENYIWQIKYMNETFDHQPGEAVAKMKELAGMLRRREVPLLLLDRGQTGRVPEVEAAVQSAYQQVAEDIRTRNTTLGVYTPRK